MHVFPHIRSALAWWAGSACVAAIGGVVLLSGNVGVFSGNQHVVAADRVYRSGQLSMDELRAFVYGHGIARIVNVRKATDPSPEYQAERALCAELDVEFVGLPFSPSRLPEPDVLRELIAIFRRGPYPILIHCEHGADRTGLASVVYRLVIEHEDLDRALDEDLSWRTGHLGLGRERAMDRVFELYRESRGELDFERWAFAVYPRLHGELEHPRELRAPRPRLEPLAGSN